MYSQAYAAGRVAMKRAMRAWGRGNDKATRPSWPEAHAWVEENYPNIETGDKFALSVHYINGTGSAL